MVMTRLLRKCGCGVARCSRMPVRPQPGETRCARGGRSERARAVEGGGGAARADSGTSARETAVLGPLALEGLDLGHVELGRDVLAAVAALVLGDALLPRDADVHSLLV